MSLRSLNRAAAVCAVLGVLALVASAGIPGQGKNDQVCGYGATWTTICNGMTTVCTSYGGTCDTCDTSSPWSGKQRKCQPQEDSNCVQVQNPGLVNCGPRTTGVCVDSPGGGYHCSNSTSNGSCLTAGDLC